MDVILQKDVKNLGSKGDVVKVAEGYGRNYLIPRGLAIEATDKNMAELKMKKKQQKKREERELQEAQNIARKIDEKRLVLKVKAGEKGRLFGSITTKDIAEKIQRDYGVELDKRKIELAQPIRTLGNYRVEIKIHPGVIATLNVVVEKQDE
ncbi:MAG: 50S ribosomal protein L9 [Firmicutes bacterium]|nr:50S ribosomal protein L9 [Bacillota bacterium]